MFKLIFYFKCFLDQCDEPQILLVSMKIFSKYYASVHINILFLQIRSRSYIKSPLEKCHCWLVNNLIGVYNVQSSYDRKNSTANLMLSDSGSKYKK